MDKDEILERSRKENKDMDLVELEANNKANHIAITVGMIVCALLTLIHAYSQNRMAYDIWTVMFSIMSAIEWVKFANLRRLHNLVGGLIYLTGTVIYFVWYLRDMLEVF